MWQCLLLSLFLQGDLVTKIKTGLHRLILAREGLRNYKEEPPAATQVLSCALLWFLFANVDAENS